MAYEREWHDDTHRRRCVVTSDSTGWNVREERDSRVVRESHHDDWHCVERAVQLFEYAAVHGSDPDTLG